MSLSGISGASCASNVSQYSNVNRSSGTTSLDSFLESLAAKLQSNGPSGNVINTQA